MTETRYGPASNMTVEGVQAEGELIECAFASWLRILQAYKAAESRNISNPARSKGVMAEKAKYAVWCEALAIVEMARLCANKGISPYITTYDVQATLAKEFPERHRQEYEDKQVTIKENTP